MFIIFIVKYWSHHWVKIINVKDENGHHFDLKRVKYV